MMLLKVVLYLVIDIDLCLVLCLVWIVYYQLLFVIICFFYMKLIDFFLEVSQQSYGVIIVCVMLIFEVVLWSKVINKVVNMVIDI